jgi:hypothetical protein
MSCETLWEVIHPTFGVVGFGVLESFISKGIELNVIKQRASELAESTLL